MNPVNPDTNIFDDIGFFRAYLQNPDGVRNLPAALAERGRQTVETVQQRVEAGSRQLETDVAAAAEEWMQQAEQLSRQFLQEEGTASEEVAGIIRSQEEIINALQQQMAQLQPLLVKQEEALKELQNYQDAYLAMASRAKKIGSSEEAIAIMGRLVSHQIRQSGQ